MLSSPFGLCFTSGCYSLSTPACSSWRHVVHALSAFGHCDCRCPSRCGGAHAHVRVCVCSTSTWGGTTWVTNLVDASCWARLMMLDSYGMDPPGIQVRPKTGFAAIDQFVPGYDVWRPLHRHLQQLGYVDGIDLVSAFVPCKCTAGMHRCLLCNCSCRKMPESIINEQSAMQQQEYQLS